MRLIRAVVLALVAIGALAPLARPSDFSWHGQIAPGQSIEIKGVNGAIRAERTTGTEVEVVAVKSARHGDPNSVTVQAVPHANGVTVCAMYPSSNLARPNECAPGNGGRMNVSNNDVRVEFTVRVPAGVQFIGRTVNGEIEAASLAGDVEAHTVNGKIRISTTGWAEGNTVNGSIIARMGQASGPRPLEFQTVNGGIDLELPSTVNATLHASTVNGHISTDFPLMIRGKFTGRQISGSIGQGGPELSLKTVNGSIDLRRAGI
jgi:hypothetical protein